MDVIFFGAVPFVLLIGALAITADGMKHGIRQVFDDERRRQSGADIEGERVWAAECTVCSRTAAYADDWENPTDMRCEWHATHAMLTCPQAVPEDQT